MKKSRLVAASLLAATLAAATLAHAETVQVLLKGLNCSLCSEEMKAKLKKVVGATDVEPKLECGMMFFDMPPGVKLSEDSLRGLLVSNGFTLEGVKQASMSMAQVRADKSLC